MRWLAALALAFAMPAWGGSLTTVGALVGSSTPLVDTYFIFPDNQLLAYIETAASGVVSPYGQLPAGQSDLETAAQWVCDHRDALNIKTAMAMGDLVRTGGIQLQWDVLVAAVAIMDGCRVPYLPTFGNHDGSAGGAVQNPDQLNSAQLYHQNVGQDVMDAKGWFAGSRAERPDWEELDALGYTIYTENTTTYKSRSFWVPIPPFNVMVPEWEYGVRISKLGYGGRPSNAVAWTQNLRQQYSHDYWIHLTHAGPCDIPDNCDLTPESIGQGEGPFGGNWLPVIDSLGPNVIAFANGHWGRQSCWGGAGVYNSAVRDDGSAWITAGYDFNCGVRQDPIAAATCAANGIGSGAVSCPSNPYTWWAWLRLKRATRELCYDTVRILDVDADDNGVPDTIPAAQVQQTGRGAAPFSDPDPLDPNTDCNLGTDSGPSDGCPNHAERCITVRDLP